jgi:16S rRNA (cytosine1402-N4)-methyltransferase
MMKRFFPRQKEKKGLACVFQALRIEVNHELDALQEFLQQTPEVLKPAEDWPCSLIIHWKTAW